MSKKKKVSDIPVLIQIPKIEFKDGQKIIKCAKCDKKVVVCSDRAIYTFGHPFIHCDAMFVGLSF